MAGVMFTHDNLTPYLERTAALHDHLCPRQVLGVRMGVCAGRLLNLELPGGDKRLYVFVETDGCFSDGVSAATGCSPGHRTMRFVDYGKAAATFVDTATGEAVRIAPHPQARTRALDYAQGAQDQWHSQLAAYQVMPDSDLLAVQIVRLKVDLGALISRPGVRVECDCCGEEIMNEREVVRGGGKVCRACAGQDRYYCPM